MFLKKLFHRHNWQIKDVIFAAGKDRRNNQEVTASIAECCECSTCGARKLIKGYYWDDTPFLHMKAYNWVNKGDKNV